MQENQENQEVILQETGEVKTIKNQHGNDTVLVGGRLKLNGDRIKELTDKIKNAKDENFLAITPEYWDVGTNGSKGDTLKGVFMGFSEILKHDDDGNLKSLPVANIFTDQRKVMMCGQHIILTSLVAVEKGTVVKIEFLKKEKTGGGNYVCKFDIKADLS